MVITAIRRHRPTEDVVHPSEETGLHRLEIPEARIRIPFSDAPRPLVIGPGSAHRLRHDGKGWWFGGIIGPEYASAVTEWPLLDELDPSQEYVLRASTREDKVHLTQA